MTFKDLFQPQLFYDSVHIRVWGGSRGATTRFSFLLFLPKAYYRFVSGLSKAGHFYLRALQINSVKSNKNGVQVYWEKWKISRL